MKKIVCDVCGQRTADIHFKVKQLKAVYSGDFSTRRWVGIDVCPVCYEKLLDSVKADNKDTICEYFVSHKFSDGEEKHVCYGTKEMEECFCRGDKNNCTFY